MAKKLFKGEKFVITGAVPGYTRKEFQSDVIDKVGAVLAKGISRNVDYVITTESQLNGGSSKLILAKGYGITLVSADWLVDSMVEGKKLPLSDYTLGEEESKPKKGKASKKRKKVESDDEEEDDEEEEDVAPKKKAKKVNTKVLFEDLRFAITGAVPGYTRKEFEQNVLTKLGAALASKVTGNTDYLLSTPSQLGSGNEKLVEARARGVPIVSADWLVDSLKSGKKLAESKYTLGSKKALPKGKNKAVKKASTKVKASAKKNTAKTSLSIPSTKLFKGNVFVISGKIPDYTRAEFNKKYITGLGAKIGSKVTSSTDYVITTEEAAESGDTAKLDAAREKGVVIVSYEWLIDCVDEGEVLDTEDFEIP